MKIKEKPEDFIVKERIDLNLCETGEFVYFKLKKINYNTLTSLKKIADSLNVKIKNIGFAGNKDKKAVTTQFCSITGVNEKDLEKLKLKDIDIVVVGRGTEPITLGRLEGNEFEIVVRDANEPTRKDKYINYFGPQRFGEDNVRIGKALITGDYKLASSLLGLKTENAVNSLQLENPKMLRFYIHAYQSHLWNQVVEEVIQKGINVNNVCLLGFGTEFDNIDVGRIYRRIMKEEGIKRRDFVNRQMPKLSSEGSTRKVYFHAKDLNIEKLDEKNYRLTFFLTKGCYATELIRQSFS